jgi:diguanylate cyclase (GGDEF)-like protein
VEDSTDGTGGVAGDERERHGRPPRVVLTTTAVLWAGALALFVALPDTPYLRVPFAGPAVWALALGPLFLLCERAAVHVEYRDQTHTMSMTDLPLALGLFFVAPHVLLLVQLAATTPVLVWRQRRGAWLPKTAFNVALYLVIGEVETLVFRGVAGGAGPGWRTWLAVLAGVTAANAVVTAAIGTVIRATDGMSPRDMAYGFGIGLTGSLSIAGGALLAVLVLVTDPRSLWLLAVTWAAPYLAYRQLVRTREQQHNLDLLHEMSARLMADAELDDVVGSLLDEVRGRFRAAVAELTLAPLDGETTATRTVVHADGRRETERVALDPAELALVVAGGGDCRVVREGDDDPLAAALDRRGVRDAMLVPLAGRPGALGLLLVGNRLGTLAGGFADADATVFATVGRQMQIALDNGRLERNIASITALKDEMRYQALHDPLTGLANRVQFAARVEEVLRDAAGEPVALLFVDLDDFKTVNDTLGHAAGDDLLRQVADRIRPRLRPDDVAARLGGDEFAICLAGVRDAAAARVVAQRLLAALAEPVDVDGHPMTIRASVGIAIGGAETDPAALLRHADTAMYMAKMQGKGRFEVFDAGLDEHVHERQLLKADLARAAVRNEFFVQYQPVVDVATRRLVGAEALVRWQRPGRGVVPPDEFVGAAEEIGVIHDLGTYVLRTACRHLREWRADWLADPAFSLGVNVSAKQLLHPAFVDDVAAVLADSGVDPVQVTLEVTESVMIGDNEQWRTSLHSLKDLGLRIAVDDFGTGYSSLSYLKDLPIDVLKVAKPFVDGLDHGTRETALVRAILGMAHGLGLGTVAEGVEREVQREVLADLGCAHAQGYLFAKPMAPEDFARLAAALRPPHARGGVVIPLPRNAADSRSGTAHA